MYVVLTGNSEGMWYVEDKEFIKAFENRDDAVMYIEHTMTKEYAFSSKEEAVKEVAGQFTQFEVHEL